MAHRLLVLPSVSGHSQHVSESTLFFRAANTISKVREAAQLTHAPDGPLFLGDGSLAAAPTPAVKSKGIRPVLKVVDDKCLYENQKLMLRRG